MRKTRTDCKALRLDVLEATSKALQSAADSFKLLTLLETSGSVLLMLEPRDVMGLLPRTYRLLAEIGEGAASQNPLVRKYRLKLGGRLAVAVISEKGSDASEVETIVSDLFEGIRDPVRHEVTPPIV
jgi:hypothetical protein